MGFWVMVLAREKKVTCSCFCIDANYSKSEKIKNSESQNHTQKFMVVGKPTHPNCHCDTFMDKTYTAAMITLLRKKNVNLPYN